MRARFSVNNLFFFFQTGIFKSLIRKQRCKRHVYKMAGIRKNLAVLVASFYCEC